MKLGQISRLGVLGGTFDPLHLGHLVAASEVKHAYGLDSVLFVPAGRPWQRTDYSSAEDRMMMTLLGTGGHPGFEVSRMEIDRSGPTYTVDTLEELRRAHPDAELFFIVGADAALGLNTWKALDRVADLAEIVVVNRSGSDLDGLSPEPEWPKVHVHEMPLMEISATDIRRRVAADEPIDFLVPAEVAGYIREKGLYVGAENG